MIEVREMDTIPLAGPWLLPKGWEWVSLGEVCKVIIGGTPDRRNLDYWGSGHTWVSIADLNTRFITSSKEEITDLGVANSNVKEIDRGTILMSFKLTIGKLAISGKKLYTNEAIAALPIKASWSERLEKDFIFHALHVVPLSNEADLAVKGRTLNKEKLARILIPIPFPSNPIHSLDIQHRIIERIEALLADLREAQNTLKSMSQDIDQVMESALLEVFGYTRDGFKVVNVLPDEVKKINSVAKIERGKFSHRPRNDPRFFGGTVPWIQIQNLPSNYSKYITDYMNTLNDLGLSVSKLFPKGTLVLSIAATIGAVGILTFDACFPDSLVGITPNSDFIDSGFLYWQLVFIQEHLEKIAPSAAQKNINLKILEQIELWVPSPSSQALINAHLDAIQEGIAHLYEMAEEDKEILQQVEQSILERAFRGEL